MLTVSVCSAGPPGHVTPTVYSFGVSGDDNVMSPIPVMPKVTVVAPVPVIVTRDDAVAMTLVPFAARRYLDRLGTAAASIVASICTLRSRRSTLTGLTNTSERNTSGTRRSVESR